MKKSLFSVSYRPRTINLCSIVVGGILLFFISYPSLSQAEVELFVAGQYFKSFADYKKNRPATNKELKDPVSDFKPYLSTGDKNKWDKIAYDHEVDNQVEGFQEAGRTSASNFILDEEDLKEAIEKTMGKTKEPVLLMADPTKMRIISLEDQDFKEAH